MVLNGIINKKKQRIWTPLNELNEFDEEKAEEIKWFLLMDRNTANLSLSLVPISCYFNYVTWARSIEELSGQLSECVCVLMTVTVSQPIVSLLFSLTWYKASRLNLHNSRRYASITHVEKEIINHYVPLVIFFWILQLHLARVTQILALSC